MLKKKPQNKNNHQQTPNKQKILDKTTYIICFPWNKQCFCNNSITLLIIYCIFPFYAVCHGSVFWLLWVVRLKNVVL